MTVAEKLKTTGGSFSPAELRAHFAQSNVLRFRGSPAYCNLTGVSQAFFDSYFANAEDPLRTPEEKIQIGSNLIKQLVDAILLPLGKTLDSTQAPQGKLTFSVNPEQRVFQICANPGPVELRVSHGELVATTAQIVRAVQNTPQGMLILQPNQLLFALGVENILAQTTGQIFLSSPIGLNLHCIPTGILNIGPGTVARLNDAPALALDCAQGLSISLASGSFSRGELRDHFSKSNTLRLTDSPASCELTGISPVLIEEYLAIVRNQEMSAEERNQSASMVFKRVMNSALLPLGKTIQVMNALNGDLTFGVLEGGEPPERVFEITATPGPLEILAEHGELHVTTSQIIRAIREGGLGQLVLQPNQLLYLLDVADPDAVYAQAQGGVPSLHFASSATEGILYFAMGGAMMVGRGVVPHLNDAPALVIFAAGGIIISLTQGP